MAFPENEGYEFRLMSGQTIRLETDGSFFIDDTQCSGHAFMRADLCQYVTQVPRVAAPLEPFMRRTWPDRKGSIISTERVLDFSGYYVNSKLVKSVL